MTVREFDLMVDPATLATAQQKRYGLRNSRIMTYTDPRVARGMRIVKFLAQNAVRKFHVELPGHNKPVRLEATYLYGIPKSRLKGKHAYREGDPCVSHAMGDADNRHKAVQDALADAGLFDDDILVSDLRIRKRWTAGTPHIHIRIEEDAECATRISDSEKPHAKEG